MSDIILPSKEGNGFSRRQFLVGSGAVLGAAALVGATTMTPAARFGARVAQAQALTSDLDILQFALTLEHLETRAYRDVNASGLLSGKVASYFADFGAHEKAHVDAITGVIQSMGATPVAEQATYYFPKFASQEEVVNFFLTVEEVGAGAYLGAAPAIKSLDILAAAAAIHNVEAQHAAALHAYRGDAEPSPAFAMPLAYEAVIAAVTPLLTAPMMPTAPAGKYYTYQDPAPSLDVAKMKVATVANTATLVFFPETEHVLAGPLLSYWQSHGGLAMFGYPITEAYNGVNPTDGKTYVTQYFQRTRLEWHPEYAGTESEVLLGLLGSEALFGGICK